MKNLSEARKKGDLEAFIKEREYQGCADGNLDKIDAVILQTSQNKLRETQEASIKLHI